MQTQTKKENFRVDELASKLGVSRETIRRWIRLKYIDAVHLRGVWMITAEEYLRIRRDGVPCKIKEK